MIMEANLKMAELLSIKKYSPICLLFLSFFFFFICPLLSQGWAGQAIVLGRRPTNPASKGIWGHQRPNALQYSGPLVAAVNGPLAGMQLGR